MFRSIPGQSSKLDTCPKPEPKENVNFYTTCYSMFFSHLQVVMFSAVPSKIIKQMMTDMDDLSLKKNHK